MIEVKNWSPNYSHSGFSPYEQTERSGKLLWLFLKSWRASPRVTNVLLSTNQPFKYNQQYRSVFVSDLTRINYFIQHRDEIFSEKEVMDIVGKLRKHVTKHR